MRFLVSPPPSVVLNFQILDAPPRDANAFVDFRSGSRVLGLEHMSKETERGGGRGVDVNGREVF